MLQIHPPSGHWEICGLPVPFECGTFPQQGTVVSVGEIGDIFTHKGVNYTVKAAHKMGLVDQLLDQMDKLEHQDLVLLSADHGCGPTWLGSDHTREHMQNQIHKLPKVELHSHLKGCIQSDFGIFDRLIISCVRHLRNISGMAMQASFVDTDTKSRYWLDGAKFNV